MFRNKIIYLIVFVIVLANGCSLVTTKGSVKQDAAAKTRTEQEDPEYTETGDIHEIIEQQESSYMEDMLSAPTFYSPEEEVSQFRRKLEAERPSYSIPITINSSVLSFIKAFRTVRRENISRALNRSVQYIDEFKRMFKEYGIPEDLAYLPLIESGYRVNAVSRARARGMWQFMASTARMYGLRVDWLVDERLDPFKAAAAAAKYLKDLHTQLGDWYLALAAYNGGTGRLNRAIRRLKTKDFFKISSHRWLLRRETRNYVPAFLASLIIAKIPQEYGFSIEPEESIFTETKIVQTPSPVSLKDMASVTGVPYETLKRINPELTHEFTPFDRKYYSIRLPLETDETLTAQLKRVPPEKEMFIGWYRVKRGDSLYGIALKFGTSVTQIKKTNKLRSNLIHPGKRLLIPRN